MSLTKLEQLAQSFPGEMGVYAKDLTTGAEVGVNADVPFYLASISKVLIMTGAVDLMNHPNRLDDDHQIEMYDYREEGKRFRFHHIGTTQTYRELLRRMISNSDTTATDMVVRIAGQTAINKRIEALGIPGLGEITSIGELDRIIRATRHDKWAEVPPYAFEPYIRNGIEDFLVPFHMTTIPGSNDSSADAYEAYYRWGLNSATPEAMGQVAERLADESLLGQGWKNDILREEIFSAAGEGAIGGAVPSARLVDTKGGAKYRVRCELGIVYNGTQPEAVIGVFAQKLEVPRADATTPMRAAANLAYKALGFSHTIPAPSTPTKGLVFTEPKVGGLYEPGVKPPIKWKSNGITGRLTLRLVRTDHDGDETIVETLSTNAIDDGEWHSYTVPDNVTPAGNYRFKLQSNNDSSLVAYSNVFALRGVIRVTEPRLGRVVHRGETPTVEWATRGVTGDLTIELFQGSVKKKTISTIAIDDGEWHSWTVSSSRAEDDNYRIRIKSNDDPSVIGWSPTFTIGGRIAVTAPKPGQVIDVGASPVIRWNSDQAGDRVTVKLLRGEESTIQTISGSAINDGEWHSWTAPSNSKDGNGYRFEIAKKGDGDIRATSHFVQIGSRLEWLVPSIEQKPFNGDPHARPHYFPYGANPTLRWRTVGEHPGKLRLQLLRAGSVVSTLSSNAINDGEWHSWSVASGLQPSSDYQFRLESKTRNQVAALSQRFHLGAMVDITLPTDDDLDPQTTIRFGDTPNILWRTDNITGRVKLELFRLDAKQLTISSNAIDDGEWHSWTVPDTLTEGGGYRFKLISKATPDVFAFSPWFAIEA